MKKAKYTWGNEIKYSFELLTNDNYKYTKNFKCGNAVINQYIHDRNKCFDNDNGVTYIFRDVTDNQILAFVVLCCSGIRAEYQGVATTMPAIEIKYFALASCVQRLHYSEEDMAENNHYYLSDFWLGEVMYKCSDISQSIIGAKYIILYSVPRGRKLYERMGFNDFQKYMNRDKMRFLNGCKPMYIEID